MNELINFFVKFFKSIGCEVKQNENTLEISNIPPNFEKFSGKRGPYLLSFGEEKEDYEPVSSNHYLIKTIREFLEGRGETTLLKINFGIDFKEEIPKRIPFLNSEIKNISKAVKNKFIFKFSFATTFQYLNEKETCINHLFVLDGNVINFDEKLELIEGNKRDFQEVEAYEEYALAKDELKKIMSPKTEELKFKLGRQLNNEILRIKQHYENNRKETEEKEKSLKKQIESNKNDSEKMKRLTKMIENLKEENNKKKMEEEEEEFIQREIKKHGLKIDSKLINTTIIYFPVYNLNLTLEVEKNNYKMIELSYNPLKKEVSPIYCKSCVNEVKEIILCSSGHITCRNCGEKCASCGSIYCKSCQIKKCAECERTLCTKCQNVCEVCGKVFCDFHITKNGRSRICKNCEKKKIQTFKF
jgi:hypothetical protein